jgi:hypothetical protein
MRTQSSSFCSSFWRADSVFSSTASRVFFLLQPLRVVALVRDAAPAIELEDPAGDVVEEITIVRHGHDAALELGEIALEPVHRLGVEVVGGLVEQQHVGLLEEHATERDAALLAARELADVGVARREAQRVHRDVHLAVQVPEIVRVDLLLHPGLLVEQLLHRRVVHRLGELVRDVVETIEQLALRRDGQLHIATHVELLVELRLLGEIADARAFMRPGFALIVGIDTGHDLEDR